MTKRSFGVTVLAFSTIMVALYSQYAAIALLVTGSVFLPSGEIAAFLTVVTGAAFVGVTAAGYVVGAALWIRRSWAWGWAVGLYLTFFVANALLATLANNFVSAILPTLAVSAAIVFLRRTTVRAELATSVEAAAPPVAATIGERHEVPKPAH